MHSNRQGIAAASWTIRLLLCLALLAMQVAPAVDAEKQEPFGQIGISQSVASHAGSACELDDKLCCQICLVIAGWTDASALLPRSGASTRIFPLADLVVGIEPKPLIKPPRRIG
jgi:hypothetical protein